MRKKVGFTLIELLVVISIIALLIAILMPALNKAREQATGSVCLANQKNLMLAYIMYADENDGRVVGGYVSETATPELDCNYQWVYCPEDDNGDPADVYGGTVPILQYRINGFRKGKLWKYLQTHEVYHCPGDSRDRKGAVVSGVSANMAYFFTYRSYSLPDCLSALPEAQIEASGYSAWMANPIRKMNQVRNPARRYVFVEDAFRSRSTRYYCFNPGGWSFDPWTSGKWWDPLAAFHNKAGTYSFFDGHVEMRHWVHQGTVEYSLNRVDQDPIPNVAVNEDMKWLWLNWPVYHPYTYY
jgi:prepilin-type N-terminal cleavage/methylation domain-containing protein/prepilin-type processing-associated H-X9-DG protein